MVITERDNIDIEKVLRLAEEIGFSHAAALNMEAIIFRQEVRDMCSADLCRSYGKSWSCPPAAGSLERITERATEYRRGVIVQTTGRLESEFDMVSIGRIMKEHHANFDVLVRQTRSLFPDCLPMGAGACRACRRCTYPDRPCRHPDKMYVSMEAYGLLVSDVALRSKLQYNYGTETMTYTSCILLD